MIGLESLIHGGAGLLFTAGAAVFFLAPESRASQPPPREEWPWDARFVVALPAPDIADEVAAEWPRAGVLTSDSLAALAPSVDVATSSRRRPTGIGSADLARQVAIAADAPSTHPAHERQLLTPGLVVAQR